MSAFAEESVAFKLPKRLWSYPLVSRTFDCVKTVYDWAKRKHMVVECACSFAEQAVLGAVNRVGKPIMMHFDQQVRLVDEKCVWGLEAAEQLVASVCGCLVTQCDGMHRRCQSVIHVVSEAQGGLRKHLHSFVSERTEGRDALLTKGNDDQVPKVPPFAARVSGRLGVRWCDEALQSAGSLVHVVLQASIDVPLVQTTRQRAGGLIEALLHCSPLHLVAPMDRVTLEVDEQHNAPLQTSLPLPVLEEETEVTDDVEQLQATCEVADQGEWAEATNGNVEPEKPTVDDLTFATLPPEKLVASPSPSDSELSEADTSQELSTRNDSTEPDGDCASSSVYTNATSASSNYDSTVISDADHSEQEAMETEEADVTKSE